MRVRAEKETLRTLLTSISWMYLAFLAGTYIYVFVTEGGRYVVNGCELDGGHLLATIISAIILLYYYPIRILRWRFHVFVERQKKQHEIKKTEKPSVPIIDLN